jgi:hypothetical protein
MRRTILKLANRQYPMYAAPDTGTKVGTDLISERISDKVT